MDKSIFYTTLCSLLDAGFSPTRALRGVMPPPFSRVAKRMAHAIDEGATLTEAMRMQKCFSPLEIALIHAGERSGSIPVSCRQLAEYFTEKKHFRAKLISGFTYPLFVYHFAGLVFTLLRHLAGNCNCLLFLLLWTAAPWALLLLWKGISPLRNSMPASAIIAPIPFFGSLQFQNEIARFMECFGRAQEAGIGMTESILLAAQVCESALYRSRFRKIAQAVDTRCKPFTECAVDALPKSWPAEILAMLQVGEATGEIPQYARRITTLLRNRLHARMAFLAKFIPLFFYLAVVIQIAVRIIGFYSGYIGMVNELLE